MTLKVLDLCSGTGSATQAFRDAGHQVITLDNDPSFHCTLTMDLQEFTKDPQRFLYEAARRRGWIEPGEHWTPDIVWCSPPCTAFSLAGSGKGRVRWRHMPEGRQDPFYGPRVPIDPVSILGCDLILACLLAVHKLKPRWWWLENPQGGLQTMRFMRTVPGPVTVTYCQYGDTRMKPSTLWGEWPEAWVPKPRCKNGDPCHVRAPRGSRTPGSTQGHRDARTRAMVPLALSRDILAAVEAEVGV